MNWGLEIKRYEITEVMPDDHIVEAMDKQAAAERERRKSVCTDWDVVFLVLLLYTPHPVLTFNDCSPPCFSLAYTD